MTFFEDRWMKHPQLIDHWLRKSEAWGHICVYSGIAAVLSVGVVVLLTKLV